MARHYRSRSLCPRGRRARYRPRAHTNLAIAAEQFEAGAEDDDPDALARQALLVLPPNEFMQYFSTYNVVLNANSPPPYQPMEYGGSADPPTLFLWPCVNKKFGCEWLSGNRHHAEAHASNCPYTSAAYVTERPVVCPKEGCVSRFEDKRHLKKHLYAVHDFTPRRCEREGCTSTEVFQVRGTYEVHIMSHDWPARRCPIADCSNTNEWINPGRLRTHLRSVHKIQSTAELDKLAPTMTAVRKQLAEQAIAEQVQQAQQV